MRNLDQRQHQGNNIFLSDNLQSPILSGMWSDPHEWIPFCLTENFCCIEGGKIYGSTISLLEDTVSNSVKEDG